YLVTNRYGVGSQRTSRWTMQYRSGFNIEAGAMPGTGDRGPLQRSLVERAAGMRARVLRGIECTIHVVDSDVNTFDRDQFDLAGLQVGDTKLVGSQHSRCLGFCLGTGKEI